MTRFEKIEKYETKIDSYNEAGDYDYTTTFSLTKPEWEAFANALGTVTELNIEPREISESQVFYVEEQEVTIALDTTHFRDETPCISIYDGDIMGRYSASLTLDEAKELLDSIQKELA